MRLRVKTPGVNGESQRVSIVTIVVLEKSTTRSIIQRNYRLTCYTQLQVNLDNDYYLNK